jgi:Tol biopolymer transport system component
VRLVESDSVATSGAFSADGRRLVYTQETERDDKKEWEDRVKKKDDGYYAEKKLTWTHVWTYDLQSKARKQLTTGMTDNQGPAISPDAKWVAFSSNRTGRGIRDANWSNNSDLYIVSANGGEPRALTTNVGPDTCPSSARRAVDLCLEDGNSSPISTTRRQRPGGTSRPDIVARLLHLQHRVVQRRFVHLLRRG